MKKVGVQEVKRLGKFELVRSHALGNDYLVVDTDSFGLALTEANIRRICDRNTGVGSDGILEVVRAPEGFDAAVRIFNPDGSEAEKSGNGVRIFAKFCQDYGYAPADRTIKIFTKGGTVGAEKVRQDGNKTLLKTSMGRISFRTADLPMTPEDGSETWIAKPLKAGDRTFTATCLSIGNPHAVLLDAPPVKELVEKYGPLIERHPYFPRRVNVQFIEVLDRGRVRAMIWERGAGWTMASGSSACAVASAAVKAGLTDKKVAVEMPGGVLEVTVGDDWQVEQVGPAQEIGRLIISQELAFDLTSA